MSIHYVPIVGCFEIGALPEYSFLVMSVFLRFNWLVVVSGDEVMGFIEKNPAVRAARLSVL